MVFSNADNLMLGASEVDRVYLGTVIVWQRGGGNIPQEVLDNVADLVSHYGITGDYTFSYGIDTDAYGNSYYFVMLFESTAPTFRVTRQGSMRDEDCSYCSRSVWTDVQYFYHAQGSSFHGALPDISEVYCTFDTANINNSSSIVFIEVS